jgi:hypothetical protein
MSSFLALIAIVILGLMIIFCLKTKNKIIPIYFIKCVIKKDLCFTKYLDMYRFYSGFT